MNWLLVPVDGKTLDWPRRVANAIKQLQNIVGVRTSFPFEPLDADPVSPQPGQTYYNTTTNKARTWDGSAWHDLW